MMLWYGVAVVIVAGAAALPVDDPVIRKLDSTRYHYMKGPDGKTHLQDLWLKASDVEKAARFDPDATLEYHLFTRDNPTVSQPIVLNNEDLVATTNFDASRRTIILVHGWLGSVLGTVNLVLIPAFLEAEDVNVIVVDWSAGADDESYLVALLNTGPAAESAARFIAWLNEVTGADVSQYHVVGHSLGGHFVGIIGRNLDGAVAYITSLDPAGPGWLTNENRFQSDDGLYTEVIHTNAGILGYAPTLGQVDFYPNGGVNMTGCEGLYDCDHDRAFYYMAESLTTTFTGTSCESFISAMLANCTLDGELAMGGLSAKTGSTGIYYLETNAAPPFSQG